MSFPGKITLSATGVHTIPKNEYFSVLISGKILTLKRNLIPADEEDQYKKKGSYAEPFGYKKISQ